MSPLDLASFPTQPLQEVESFSSPGTGDVTPSDLKKVSPLIKHYASQAKPFTACKRDQLKHGLSEDHANRRCAVLMDLGAKAPGWRSREEAADTLGWPVKQLNEFIAECELELRSITASVGPEVLAEAISGGVGFMLLESAEAEQGPESLLEVDLSQKGRAKMAKAKTAMPDGSFPIPNVEFLRKAVKAFGRAKNKPAAKAWIKMRARALGATKSVPSNWAMAEAESELFYLGEEAASVVALFGELPTDGTLNEAYSPPSWVLPKQARQPGFKPVNPPKKSSTSSSSGYAENQHPRGAGGKWIAKGHSGPAVTGIQKRLGIKTTGTFDKNTVQRVRAYQKSHGLQVDGIVGAQTASSLLGKSARAPGVLPSGLRSALQALRTKRLREGEVWDGESPLSERTVHTEARQRDNGVKSASHSSIRSALFDLANRDSPTHTVKLPNGTTVKAVPPQQPGYGSYGRTFTVANGSETLSANGIEETADTAKELDSRQGAGASGSPVAPAVSERQSAPEFSEESRRRPRLELSSFPALQEKSIRISGYVTKDGRHVGAYMQIRKAIAKISDGGAAHFPDGITVKQTKGGYEVYGGAENAGSQTSLSSVDKAALDVAARSANSKHPKSIGGTTRYDGRNVNRVPADNPKLPGTPHPEFVADRAAKARKAAKLPSRKERARNEAIAGIKNKISGLKDGESREVGDGVTVRRSGGTFEVVGAEPGVHVGGGVDGAAREAYRRIIGEKPSGRLTRSNVREEAPPVIFPMR